MIKIKKVGDLGLDKKIREITHLIEKGKLENDLAELAKDHFVDAFPTTKAEQGGGQTDSSKGGWVDRKKDYKHPIMNKTGALKDSIKVDRNTVYTNNEYASYHNKGGGWLPKREFIGKSMELIEDSKQYIYKILNKIFK